MKKYTAGLLICLAISVPAWFLGRLFPVVGGPVCAILIGMAIAPFIKGKERFRPGIAFTSKKILQYAVVLLGFGMNLSVVLEKGRQSLPIILATITTSILIAVLPALKASYEERDFNRGRFFHLRRFRYCRNCTGH